MSEWREIELGEIIKTNQSSVDQGYPYSDILYLDTGSVTCNRISGLQKFSLAKAPSRAKRLVKDLDIIYSSVRPNQLHYGIIRNPENNLVVSTGFVVITCNEDEIAPYYLYHYLSQNTIKEFLHSIAEGSTSTYPSLKPSDIESLEILLPPLPEQRAIASVLSSLDDKIDLLHRQNKTLEQMAETLFRQWFVPARADKPHAGGEEADSACASHAGGEGWEEGVLGDEFDFTMGQSPSGSSFNEDGIGTPMYQGNRDFGFRFPENRVFTTEPKRFAEKQDTLISVRAPVGEQNMANEKCCIGRGVAAFRYKTNSAYYTYTYFKMKSLMDEIKQFNETGTVFGSISKNDFQEMEVIIPPINRVKNFQNEVKPIDDKIITNCTQIRTLTALRDTLLPKLMSGEIRIDTNE